MYRMLNWDIRAWGWVSPPNRWPVKGRCMLVVSSVVCMRCDVTVRVPSGHERRRGSSKWLALYWLCVYRLYKSSMIMMRSAPVATVPPCIRLWPFSRLMITNALLIFLCAPHSKEDSHLSWIRTCTSLHPIATRSSTGSTWIFFLDICSKGRKKTDTKKHPHGLGCVFRGHPWWPINAIVKMEIVVRSNI
jgi:hypothetical protein